MTIPEAMLTGEGLPPDALPEEPPELLTRLHARLEAAAVGESAPDVHYRTVDSPLGPLLVAATEAGVVRVAFDREGQDAVLQSLADRLGPRVLRTPKRLDAVAHQLDEYFEGSRRAFDVPLDLRLARGFRLVALERLREVGYGSTVTYAALAAAAGRPAAVRATGTACATNPLPLLVPCHRVIRSDGTVGSYLGGPEAKVRLLALEGAR
jgi:methylated-DNA-[protein]-cysteine S-methyltransferase